MEFRDLKKQYDILRTEIDNRIQKVCAETHYIAGPEVSELEEKLAAYVGAKHCITCANGTDALTLALKTWGVGRGDAVFVPDFTFFSSGECPASLGATCFFVDVDKNTYNIDPVRLEEAIQKVIAEGKNVPKVVVAVDLFGLPADYEKIKPICEKYNLLLLEDAAQGFGGKIGEKKACSFGDIATTSFFPAKPLGCYGDGGAIFTDNDDWASLIRSYAVHGKAGDDKYNNIRLGLNSRLDTIQAAILLVKLEAFQKYEVLDSNKVAQIYNRALYEKGLDKKLILPEVRKGYMSSWAQYTVQIPDNTDRNKVQAAMKEKGIPTMVYYMKPMHKQGAFVGTDSEMADCPVTNILCNTVLSLPMHPYMTEEMIYKVVNELAQTL